MKRKTHFSEDVAGVYRSLVRKIVRLRQQRAEAEAARDRAWSAFMSSPEGQEYQAKYGTEDWESLH